MASPALKPQAPRPQRIQPIREGAEDGIRGFTKQPHEYEYLVTGNKLSGLLQSNLLYWIGRNTWGKANRPEWARLSITELAKLCGEVERKSVATALADLLERGIIAAPDRNGCAANTPKMYKLCPENWRKAPSYKPPVDPELVKLAKQVEAGWQADAEEDEHPERIVAPGKSSKPMTVALPRKDAEPFPVRIVYYCEFDEPVSFRARPGRNGRLNVTACRPAATAPPCSPAQLHTFANPSPPVEENTELARYRAYLFPLVMNLWDTGTDEAFIRSVFELAAGAPLETFQDQVALKFPNPKEARKHKPGLLRNLAAQAAKTHAVRQELEKERLRKMPVIEPQTPPEPLDLTRRWDRIRQELKARLTPESYENWFARTRQIQQDADSMTVVANGDNQEADFIVDEYTNLIREICAKLNEPSLIIWRAGK